MNETKRTGTLVTIFLATGVFTASEAQAGRIQTRAERQQARIAQGISSGALTAREAARIEAREAALDRDVRIMRRGGLSPRERARIERRQDRLSRQIYRQKHDRQKRPR